MYDWMYHWHKFQFNEWKEAWDIKPLLNKHNITLFFHQLFGAYCCCIICCISYERGQPIFGKLESLYNGYIILQAEVLLLGYMRCDIKAGIKR